MALESGVPVVPVAIHGSLGIRKWRKLRFPKVTVQYAEPITFDVVANPSREQQLEAATRGCEGGSRGRRRPGRDQGPRGPAALGGAGDA